MARLKYPQRFGKLSPDDIDAIRSAAKQRRKLLQYIHDNLSYEALALKHGVAVTSISRVVNRVIYDAVL